MLFDAILMRGCSAPDMSTFYLFLNVSDFNSFYKLLAAHPASHGCLLGFRITVEYADNSAIFTRFIFQRAIQDFDATL